MKREKGKGKEEEEVREEVCGAERQWTGEYMLR